MSNPHIFSRLGAKIEFPHNNQISMTKGQELNETKYFPKVILDPHNERELKEKVIMSLHINVVKDIYNCW